MHSRPVVCVIAVVLAGLAVVGPASAQDPGRIYTGVLIGTYATDADHVSGRLEGPGITAGVRALPWLDVDVEFLKPIGLLSREHTGRSVSFTGPGPPEQFVLTRFIHERRTDLVFSAGVVFHPALPIRRLTPRFFVGVANHRVRDRTVLEHLYLPPGVTLEQVNRTMPQGGWRTRNLGGPSIGGSLAIDLSSSLSIAPEVRYDYGSIGDEINNWLRTSVRVLWRF